MGHSATGGRRIAARERDVEAVELRKQGLSYREIAERLGVSVAVAHKLVTRALVHLNERLAEDVPLVRRLELERLDRWLARLEGGIAVGDPGAITTALRLSERRAKITGLDMPARTAIGGDAEGVPLTVQARDLSRLSDDELSELARLVKKLDEGRDATS